MASTTLRFAPSGPRNRAQLFFDWPAVHRQFDLAL